jgi:hypothetical protein
MRSRSRFGAAAVAALVLSAGAPLATATGNDAAPCVSGAEVRAQVHALVAGLRDDIRAKSTRAQVAAALVETLKTSRGAQADTPQERRELGQEIAALAKQLSSAPDRVARKAIVLEILALTEQRQRGPLTVEERAEIKAAVAALRRAVVARTDGGAEGPQVAAAFKALHEQFVCKPA